MRDAQGPNLSPPIFRRASHSRAYAHISDFIFARAHTGAEFWSAFFFTSTLALPFLLYGEEQVTLKALILSLSGVALAICFVGGTAFLQARAEADSYRSW